MIERFFCIIFFYVGSNLPANAGIYIGAYIHAHIPDYGNSWS